MSKSQPKKPHLYMTAGFADLLGVDPNDMPSVRPQNPAETNGDGSGKRPERTAGATPDDRPVDESSPRGRATRRGPCERILAIATALPTHLRESLIRRQKSGDLPRRCTRLKIY